MEKISATIIALNEEKRIAACLESLRDVAEEVIVVDSGSTDATVSICHNYGCKVTLRPFDGFGAQRQYATSLTTHQHVLSIDADEVLSPALRQSIIALKETGFTHRVYSMSRLNFYCGYPVKRCGWYPDHQIRLFDKRYAAWNLRDVAEKVIFRDSVRPNRSTAIYSTTGATRPTSSARSRAPMRPSRRGCWQPPTSPYRPWPRCSTA